MKAFQNPTNGYTEKLGIPFLWCLLFGAFYFLYKGIWLHAIISLVLAFMTFGISWLLYPFFAKAVVEQHYLRKGWILVENEAPQTTTKQANFNISQETTPKAKELDTANTDDGTSKLKSGVEKITRYTVFAFCLMMGLGLITSDFSAVLPIVGLGFLVLGLMFLPQIKQVMAEKSLNKPAIKILAVVGILTLLTYIAALGSSNSESTDTQQAVAEQQKKQADFKQEAEKVFAENPDKSLQDIQTYAENNNWWRVKTETEFLLGTEHPEIKKLHDKAIAELAKQEEEKRKQEQERLAKQAEAAAAALWSYSHKDDPMSKGLTHTASISSSNTVNFDFPYGGAQHGRLTLRTSPQYGKDVIFSIEKGQILCPSYDSCTVRVRFDDEDATSYTAVGAADNSTETIFIRNYSAFVEKMMKAKRVRFSMNIYQEGAPVFDFDVSGFNVEKYKPEK